MRDGERLKFIACMEKINAWQQSQYFFLQRTTNRQPCFQDEIKMEAPLASILKL